MARLIITVPLAALEYAYARPGPRYRNILEAYRNQETLPPIPIRISLNDRKLRLDGDGNTRLSAVRELRIERVAISVEHREDTVHHLTVHLAAYGGMPAENTWIVDP